MSADEPTYQRQVHIVIPMINNKGENIKPKTIQIISANNIRTYITTSISYEYILKSTYLYPPSQVKALQDNLFCGDYKLGTTSERPVLNSKINYFYYFDTTLNKPIWWTGTKWVDAIGADV